MYFFALKNAMTLDQFINPKVANSDFCTFLLLFDRSLTKLIESRFVFFSPGLQIIKNFQPCHRETHHESSPLHAGNNS